MATSSNGLFLPAVAFTTLTTLATLATVSACGRSVSSTQGAAPTDASVTEEPLRVAAAADLGVAFKEIGAAYEKKTGRRVDFTFGSTGLLAKQLREGAPFDVFAAASTSFVDEVIASGVCDAATKAPYAVGRLAVFVRSGAPPSLVELARGDAKRIAIANPEHAPYGKAAREALVRAGVWSLVEKRMVYGENVQQAHELAASGNADAAIIALSLAVSAHDGAFVEVDPSLYTPLDQALVVCKGKGTARDRAKDFARYVASDESRAVLTRSGFSLPRATATP